MDKFVDIVSERKIREAIERGELNNLPKAGKPVTIENFYFLPPEFRFAYTVLKNGGYLNLADDDKQPVPYAILVIYLMSTSLIPSKLLMKRLQSPLSMLRWTHRILSL